MLNNVNLTQQTSQINGFTIRNPSNNIVDWLSQRNHHQMPFPGQALNLLYHHEFLLLSLDMFPCCCFSRFTLITPNMESCIDFIKYLETDMVLNIFKCLDDPADLVRASIVSRDWRDFVIDSGLVKQLCMRLFPQLANAVKVTEPDCKKIPLADVGSSKSMEREILMRYHKAFASLLHALTKLKSSPIECIAEAVSASSTDNYPDESISNTLEPGDRFLRRASYWSSKGQKDPSVPETLIYRLKSDLCVITEIYIQPFEAFFELGEPIYSAKSVRFRMGHPKFMEVEDYECLSLEEPADDKFVWTYTSPEFTMAQKNLLQHFKFPEPVLCVGGFLQIELLGRVQREEIDGLLYICVSHVKVLGRPLSPTFHAEILEPSGKFLLKYFPGSLQQTLQIPPEPAPVRLLTSEEMFWGHVGMLHYLAGGDQEIQEDDDGVDLDEENEWINFFSDS